MLSGEEIDANARTFQEQAFTVLDRDRIEVRRNSEWLDMSMEDLFALARTTTVAQMLERDDFAKRLAAGFPGWSVSVVSARAASAALDDVEYVRIGVKRNTDDRQEFMNQANARMLRCIDSQTNFVMMNPQRPPSAFRENRKISARLCGFDNSECIFLSRHR